MAITVEDGTSKTDSDSYISITDADTYFDTRLHCSDWTDATDPIKEAALKQSARALNYYMKWIGWKTESTQAMQWPRTGIYYDGDVYYSNVGYQIDWEVYSVDDDSIPQEVIAAQCELALVLIGLDTQKTADTAGFGAIGVTGAVSLTIDKNDRVKEIPDHVFKMINHFGNRKGGSTVKLQRC